MKLRKGIKILLYFLIAIIGILCLFLVSVNLPFSHSYLTKQVNLIFEKARLPIHINSVKTIGTGGLSVRGILIFDPAGDTILYADELKAEIRTFALVKRRVIIPFVKLKNADLKLFRNDTLRNLNIIEAFAPKATSSGSTPEISKKPWEVSIRKVDLSDIKLQMNDKVSGISASLKIDQLLVKTDNMSIVNQVILVQSLDINGMTGSIKMDESMQKSDETVDDSSWSIGLSYLSLNDINFSYDNKLQKSFLDIVIGEASVKTNKTDLSNKTFDIEKVSLSRTSVILCTSQNPADPADSAKKSENPFLWNISGDNIELENVSFASCNYSDSLPLPVVSEFGLANLEMSLSDLKLSNTEAGFDLKKTKFDLSNGFSVKKLKAELNSREGIYHLDVSAETGNSMIILESEIAGNIFDIITKPLEIQKGSVGLKNTSISLKDFLFFKNDLPDTSLIIVLAKDPFTINGNIKILNSVASFSEISFSQAQNFGISVQGQIENLFIPEKSLLNVNFRIPGIKNSWLNEIMKLSGVNEIIPVFKKLSIEGSLSDSFKAPGLSLKLSSDLGNININGAMDIEKDSFSIYSIFDKLQLGTILKTAEFGSFSGSGKISGSGIRKKNIIANALLIADSLRFNNYDYTNLRLDCSIQPPDYSLNLQIDDPSLKWNLDAKMNLNDSVIFAKAGGSFHAKLRNLQLTKDSLDTGGLLNAEFIMRGNEIESKLIISEMKLTTPRDVANISKITALFRSDSLSTDLMAKGDFFNMVIHVRKPVSEMASIIKEYRNYAESFIDPKHINTNSRVSYLSDLNASVNFSFHNSLGILMNDSTLNFSNLNLTIKSNKSEGMLKYIITGKEIKYKQLEIADLNVNLTDSAGIMNLEVAANDGILFSHHLDNLRFKNTSSNWHSESTLSLLDENNKPEYLFEINTDIDSNYVVLTIPSKQLLLNGVRWQMDSPELFTFSRSAKTISPSLKMHTGNSFLHLLTDKNEGLPIYKCELNNVSFASLIRDDLLTGKPVGSISGLFEYGQKGEQMKINTDMQINDVSWSEINFDKIAIKGYFISGKAGTYSFDMITGLDSSEILLKGEKPEIGNRSLIAEFKNLPIKASQPFVSSFLSDMKGTVSGNFNISTINDIESLSGKIDIVNGNLRVNALNSIFKIPEDQILFTGKKMILNNFIVLDSLDNELFVDGSIDFSNKKAIVSDLNIGSSGLQIMNKTEADNSSFFGKIYIDSKLSIKGLLTSPVLRGRILLARGTEIFFAQKENLSLTESEKVITFVSNKPVEEQKIQNNQAGQIYNKTSIESVIEIDPTTRINIDLTKKLYSIGLMIQGGGVLNYNMLVNSQVNLTGKYVINSGKAEMKMIGWPNKEFRITEGGFISWDGRLEDPELKFEAINKVKSSYTNPVDGKERNVDFNVTLRLANRLSELEIVFTISTPDQYLMSIINTMSPEEQTRQAITILLFQKIDLPGISTSSDYMSEQVNQIVASQLNSLTKTSIKGVDISFGLDSHVQATASGGEETKTSLSYEVKKAFLDNRVQVEVSGYLNDYNKSPSSSDVSLNNFSFEYRLDSAATKFLKVYNEHTYEDVFEGEVVRTGIGFTYRKAYPRLGDIWKREKKTGKTNKQGK
jgi:hypothetical protein